MVFYSIYQQRDVTSSQEYNPLRGEADLVNTTPWVSNVTLHERETLGEAETLMAILGTDVAGNDIVNMIVDTHLVLLLVATVQD